MLLSHTMRVDDEAGGVEIIARFVGLGIRMVEFRQWPGRIESEAVGKNVLALAAGNNSRTISVEDLLQAGIDLLFEHRHFDIGHLCGGGHLVPMNP